MLDLSVFMLGQEPDRADFVSLTRCQLKGSARTRHRMRTACRRAASASRRTESGLVRCISMARTREIAWWKVIAGLTAGAVLAARLQKPARSAQRLQGEQAVRLAERGRGRRSDSPVAVPAVGWWDILLRSIRDFSEDRLFYVSGGVAFFILLAFVPGLTAFVSLYGLLSDPATVQQHLLLLEGLLPADAFSLVSGEVERIAEQGTVTLGLASILSVLVALWSANAGMKALLDGLNVAYAETEKRGFLSLTLVSFMLTVGMFAFLALVAAAIALVPLVLGAIALGGFSEGLLTALRWPILFLVVGVALSVLFRYGPSRRMPKWRWVTPGSLAAAAIWLAASGLFSWYLANFADYNATYGSLGAAIGFMMWLWITATVILAGAKLDAELEHQTARDTTVGPDRPIGARGATVADTSGAAQG